MTQGILERIEANQLKILALLEGATAQPTASAPEAPKSPVAPTTGETSAPTAPPKADSTQVATDVELDSDGVPWDERIHSSNKKRAKGGTGPWMKRKNVDKDEYARITAELREKYSGKSGAQRPHTVEGESQPVTPPPPAKSGTATPPPPPGAGTPPPPAKGSEPATAAEVPARGEAIAAINVLTNKHSVNYDAVIQYFIDNYNVSAFEQIPPAKYDFVAEDCTNWAERLVTIATQVADIKKVYVNDVTVIEPYIEKCWANASLGAEPCANYTDVPFDQLDKVEPAIQALHAQCSGI